MRENINAKKLTRFFEENRIARYKTTGFVQDSSHESPSLFRNISLN